MDIRIKKEVFHRYPNLKIAFIAVTDIDNRTKLKESKHLLNEAEKLVRLTFNKETVKSHHLISPWAVARQEFGRKAKHYQTSVEKLLEKVLSGKSVAAKDTLTNLIHYLALKNIVPFAIDDLKKINKEFTFSIATGKEKKRLSPDLTEGIFYCHDSKTILGTKLDYWKNPKTALSTKSTAALIHLDALPPLTTKKIKEVVDEAGNLISGFCGGKAKMFILDKKNNHKKI
ncbi:MAG: hypothetical protein AABW48_01060 [Nanoarchaeota archaeon]